MNKKQRITSEKYRRYCIDMFDKSFGDIDPKFGKRVIVFAVWHDVVEPARKKEDAKFTIRFGNKYVDENKLALEEFDRFKDSRSYVELFMNLNGISTEMRGGVLHAYRTSDEPFRSPVLAAMKGEDIKCDTFICTSQILADFKEFNYFVDNEFIRETMLEVLQRKLDNNLHPPKDFTKGLDKEFDIDDIQRRLESSSAKKDDE